MSWYVAVLEKYAIFSGRARRKEFWMYFLFTSLIVFALTLISNSLDGFLRDLERIEGFKRIAPQTSGVLANLYVLATLVPGLADSVRRLHDTGRNGWWVFIAFVPLIGGLVLLIFQVQDGESGENRYGPDPKVASL